MSTVKEMKIASTAAATPLIRKSKNDTFGYVIRPVQTDSIFKSKFAQALSDTEYPPSDASRSSMWRFVGQASAHWFWNCTLDIEGQVEIIWRRNSKSVHVIFSPIGEVSIYIRQAGSQIASHLKEYATPAALGKALSWFVIPVK